MSTTVALSALTVAMAASSGAPGAVSTFKRRRRADLSLPSPKHTPAPLAGPAGHASPCAWQRREEIVEGKINRRVFTAAVHPEHRAVAREHPIDFRGKQKRVD